MKKTLTLIAALLLTAATGMAQTINVHKTDGTTVSYPASEVEYVDFTAAPTDNPGGNNGHAPEGVVAVDLGLPSGTKWANMNVGATKPEDYGDYFAWGETEPKENYSWETYKWCNGNGHNLTKYNTNSSYGPVVDNKTALDLEDDVAHVNWGGDWRMPTHYEVYELTQYTTSELTEQNGVKGRRFTSKTNGRSVFLPAAGNCLDGELSYVGSGGYYWTSTLGESVPSYAYCLFFSSGIAGFSPNYRNEGFPVRPVR